MGRRRDRLVTATRSALAVGLTVGLLAGCGDDKGASGSAAFPTPAATPRPFATAAKASAKVSATPTVSPAPTPSPLRDAADVLVKGKDFTVLMPDRPLLNHEEAGEGDLKVFLDQYTASSDTATYAVQRGEYPQFGPTVDEAMTDEADVDGGKVVSSKRLTYREYPAMDGVIVGGEDDEGHPAVVFARVVVVGRYLYVLTYIAKGSTSRTPPAAFTAYVASLRFT